MTDNLGVEWFMYVGRNKDTTREFCEHLAEKCYVHISELPDIVKGKIDGHRCELYERTGLPKGMIAGTTVDNFMVNNGGWNCGHKLVPVGVEAVPEGVRARVEMKNKYLRNPLKGIFDKKNKLQNVSDLEQYAVDNGLFENRDRINLQGLNVDLAKKVIEFIQKQKQDGGSFICVRVENIDGLAASVPVYSKGVLVGFKLSLSKKHLEYLNDIDGWIKEANELAISKGFSRYSTISSFNDVLKHEQFHYNVKNSLMNNKEIVALFESIKHKLKGLSFSSMLDADEAYAEIMVFKESGGKLTRDMEKYINTVNEIFLNK